MLDKFLELVGTVIGIIFAPIEIVCSATFLSIIIFYPIVLGVFVYLSLYLTFAILQRKRLSKGGKKRNAVIGVLLHTLFFVLAVVVAFLSGLISLKLDELFAWELIPAICAYLAGAITYVLFNIPKRFRNKKLVPVLAVIFISLAVFVVAEIVGLSFVKLTLM